MIEYAVLSSIQSKGLAIGAGIGKSMDIRPLRDPPGFESAAMDKPVLYRPQKFNFKAVDGIIVLIKPDKRNDEESAKKTTKKTTRKNVKEEKKKEKKKLLTFPQGRQQGDLGGVRKCSKKAVKRQSC
jgi:hypothetical protein